MDGLSSTFFVIQRGTTMYITFNSIDQFAPCLPETFEKCFFYIYNMFNLEDTKWNTVYTKWNTVFIYMYIFIKMHLLTNTISFFHQCFNKLGKRNRLTELDLTYSSAYHQHNETVNDGTTPEQANLSVVLPTNENSL